MSNEMNELYESIILASMIDYVCAEKPALRSIIESADMAQKRTLILNFLEENNPEHRLMCSNIQKTVKLNKGATKHIKDVVKMLREYVEVSDTETKTMGEVMTPISLVEEMLDTLPYEVWTNPELKWLDPCNGVGTFPSVIIQRLMKGLSDWQPDEELRYEHIMENMLYVSELQEKNLFLYLYAFDPENKYDPNVFCGSYLSKEFDYHMKEVWEVDKFDVIVMNPPYQEQKEGFKKSNPLWNKFVFKTIDQLVEGGYLVAVHPSGWRNVDGTFKNVQTLLKSKQLTYLEVHSEADGQKTFGATTAYDFYCVHNIPNTMFTKIKCLDGSIERADLSEMEFIPNGMYTTIQNLIAKKDEEKVNVLFSWTAYEVRKEHMSNVETNEFKYPCVDNVDLKNEISKVWFSNTKSRGFFDEPKVMFGKRRCGMYVDSTGEYGLTQNGYAIADEVKNLERIKQAMLHPDFIKLMSNVNFSSMVYNYKVLALFRKDFWKEFLY